MKTLIILIGLTSFCYAGFHFQDWQKDKWNSKQGEVLIYDKLEHFTGSLILEQAFHLTLPRSMKKWSPFYAFGCGLLWEIKDGLFIPQGFSKKDLIADMGGVVGSIILRMALRKIF